MAPDKIDVFGFYPKNCDDFGSGEAANPGVVESRISKDFKYKGIEGKVSENMVAPKNPPLKITE